MRALETERLRIGNFLPEDWRRLQRLIVWYMSSPFSAYDHPWPTSDEELRDICRWFASNDEFLAVRLKENGRLIGYISLSPTEKDGAYNLGYCFDGKYHRQGYAGESCRAVIEYAFHELRAIKIVTGTAEANKPSVALLKKLGFRETARSTASFRRDDSGAPIAFTGCAFELSNDSPTIEQKISNNS